MINGRARVILVVILLSSLAVSSCSPVGPAVIGLIAATASGTSKSGGDDAPPLPVKIIYVDGTGGSDTQDGSSWEKAVETIQKGIDLADDDWTVLVADGTYTGTGNRDIVFGGKAIHLKSANGAPNCIINCENTGRAFHFRSSETADTVVEGFTIRNGR
jgi:hypothetical protein